MAQEYVFPNLAVVAAWLSANNDSGKVWRESDLRETAKARGIKTTRLSVADGRILRDSTPAYVKPVRENKGGRLTVECEGAECARELATELAKRKGVKFAGNGVQYKAWTISVALENAKRAGITTL